MTKIALITGGSRGLGKNMALHLANKGRDIILTYRTQKDQADAVVETIQSMGRRAVAIHLDVGNSKSFSRFAGQVSDALNEHWGREDFDYLVNNAGTGVFNDYLDITEEEFGRMVNEHIKGPFFLSQTLLPVLKNGGRILNVSSGLTRMAIPGFSAYAMMKAALETLSVYMAKELGVRGITVNTLAPGAIETDFGGGYVRDTPEVNEQLAAMTALGRVGLPDDVGGAVAAILDDDAGWINAQRIEVSGGQGI